MEIKMYDGINIEKLTLLNQLNKIQEEIEEMKIELFKIKKYFSGQNINIHETFKNLGEEIFDSIQAIYTLQRMYFDFDEIKNNNRKHIEKMKSRYENK